MSWTPSLGAVPEAGGTRFHVWAPDAQSIEVILDAPSEVGSFPLQRTAEGYFTGWSASAGPGALYRYRIDGEGPFPDPASRYQPEGVHGPSQVVFPGAFAWSDAAWSPPPRTELAFYELHVGTFTPEGTFRAARERLPYLRDLGVTAVELMPVADFPGRRNWGYDGVALFAPARCYGTPDELRALVDVAHRLGLAVFLDVVYNHFGPDGAYAVVFSKDFFSRHHKSPWGAGINLDGVHSGGVRRFFIENAVHWLHEYHFDGLRLDATHALVDDSPRHFLAELTATVRSSLNDAGRRAYLIAEDHRNLAHMVKPEAEGGWGLDAVWADDFHHQMRRLLAGDSDGYFVDYSGTPADVAETLRRGWFFRGQHSAYFGGPRGTDPAGAPLESFVICIQNHDQVGNRAMGDRLNHAIDLAAYRAASTLLLLAPETPLLFMGQEWAASTPFQYFTDHHEELGRLVTEGRRNEFKRFRAFSDPAVRQRIPDPQDPRTFDVSRLIWAEREREPHASMHRLYRRLLSLRREERQRDFDVSAPGPDAVVLRTSSQLAVVRLRGSGVDDLRGRWRGRGWAPILTTEDPPFARDSQPPEVTPEGPVIRFHRPGAVVFRLEEDKVEGS